jgi:hypothetical protein
MDRNVYTGPETWAPWVVNWSAVWTGSLASLSASLVFGMFCTGIGATSLEKLSSWHTIGLVNLIATICAVFFSFVIGGWAAGKITGARYAEPAILHAAISWLVATPLLVAMLAIGAGTALNGWYGGLITSPFGAAATAAVAPDVVRNTATAAATALLIGLLGSVIGGWMAAGEPMTFTYYRKRIPNPREQKEAI